MGLFLDLDRVSPTKRPEGDNAGTQKWTELLFLHWTFAPEVIRPLVPKSLELDLYDGRAYVGMVPFRMDDIRSAWMPKRAGLEFLETNVRTYVHHRGKPGCSSSRSRRARGSRCASRGSCGASRTTSPR